MSCQSNKPARKRNGREGKAPAFQFYPADFLVDEAVMLMSMAEVGIYVTLLAFAWREGSIPADERDRARLCRCSVLVMRQAWERVSRCWEPHASLPLRLINQRQEATRCAHAEWVQLKHDAGVQGGRKSASLRAAIQADVKQPSTSASASASASAISLSVPSEVQAAPPPELAQTPPEVVKVPTGPEAEPRRLPAPLTREEREATLNAALTIKAVERLEAGRNGDVFRPGQWWGHSKKERRRLDLMESTLSQLLRRLESRDRPDNPWAYCEATYQEKRADYFAGRAANECEAMKHATTIFDD